MSLSFQLDSMLPTPSPVNSDDDDEDDDNVSKEGDDDDDDDNDSDEEDDDDDDSDDDDEDDSDNSDDEDEENATPKKKRSKKRKRQSSASKKKNVKSKKSKKKKKKQKSTKRRFFRTKNPTAVFYSTAEWQSLFYELVLYMSKNGGSTIIPAVERGEGDADADDGAGANAAGANAGGSNDINAADIVAGAAAAAAAGNNNSSGNGGGGEKENDKGTTNNNNDHHHEDNDDEEAAELRTLAEFVSNERILYKRYNDRTAKYAAATLEEQEQNHYVLPTDPEQSDRISALTQMGFVFEARLDYSLDRRTGRPVRPAQKIDAFWRARYDELLAFRNEQPHAGGGKSSFPNTTTKLGRWVDQQRMAYREYEFHLERFRTKYPRHRPLLPEEMPHRTDKKEPKECGMYYKITAEKIRKLNAIPGFHWELHHRKRNFEDRLEDYKAYVRERGHGFVPQRYKGNNMLGLWVMKTRYQYQKYKKGEKTQMTAERVKMLEEAGFEFSNVRKGLRDGGAGGGDAGGENLTVSEEERRRIRGINAEKGDLAGSNNNAAKPENNYANAADRKRDKLMQSMFGTSAEFNPTMLGNAIHNQGMVAAAAARGGKNPPKAAAGAGMGSSSASHFPSLLMLTVSPGRLGINLVLAPGGMGAVITDVDPACTFRGQVREGDRIVTIDGRRVLTLEDLSTGRDRVRKFGIVKQPTSSASASALATTMGGATAAAMEGGSSKKMTRVAKKMARKIPEKKARKKRKKKEEEDDKKVKVEEGMDASTKDNDDSNEGPAKKMAKAAGEDATMTEANENNEAKKIDDDDNNGNANSAKNDENMATTKEGASARAEEERRTDAKEEEEEATSEKTLLEEGKRHMEEGMGEERMVEGEEDKDNKSEEADDDDDGLPANNNNTMAEDNAEITSGIFDTMEEEANNNGNGDGAKRSNSNANDNETNHKTKIPEDIFEKSMEEGGEEEEEELVTKTTAKGYLESEDDDDDDDDDDVHV